MDGYYDTLINISIGTFSPHTHQYTSICCTCSLLNGPKLTVDVLVPEPDEPKLMDDIAVNERIADPCTYYGCLWPKYSDGKMYVPYVINNDNENTYVIKRWILLSSRCYSYVGRQGYSQTVSLDRNGCLYHSTVQHELLHALGFNHEQTTSKSSGRTSLMVHYMKCNFNKINTLNQGTPYDYSSVMQYERYAFSKNGLPTMIPIPNNNAALGTSTEMSQNDIIRINRLYQCCE
uniref:Metalloendopeptidase n=1 Tax=Sinocyclocheilus grahami TaxID=75366 RepID=A0A672QW28_SINGR